MKYNKSNIPVENFLNRVHVAAYTKYIKKQQDDIGQAKELQAFFRTLKDIASGKDPQENIFDRAIMNELVQEIDTQLKKMDFQVEQLINYLEEQAIPINKVLISSEN